MYSLFGLLLFSCENFLECLIQIDPEIDQAIVKDGTIHEPYYQIISAHVKNDPEDDFYEYFFDVYGNLPEGLSIQYNFRNIEIYGTPVESGIFRFTVAVAIGAYDDGAYYDPNPTCNGVAEKTFEFRIAEE